MFVEILAGVGAGALLFGSKKEHHHHSTCEDLPAKRAAQEVQNKRARQLYQERNERIKQTAQEVSTNYKIPLEIASRFGHAAGMLANRVRDSGGLLKIDLNEIQDDKDTEALIQLLKLEILPAHLYEIEINKQFNIRLKCITCHKPIKGTDFWWKCAGCSNGLEKDDL